MNFYRHTKDVCKFIHFIGLINICVLKEFYRHTREFSKKAVRMIINFLYNEWIYRCVCCVCVSKGFYSLHIKIDFVKIFFEFLILKFLSTHNTQEICNPIKVSIYRDLINNFISFLEKSRVCRYVCRSCVDRFLPTHTIKWTNLRTFFWSIKIS